MDLKNIIIGIVVVLLIYFIYIWIFGDSSRSYLLGMHDAKKKQIIDGSHFPKGSLYPWIAFRTQQQQIFFKLSIYLLNKYLSMITTTIR